LTLVQPARPELRLLDPQVTRELGVVAAHLLDEVVGVLATNVSIASPSGWSRLERRSTIAYEHHHTQRASSSSRISS
jgi:hypothetical protein